MPYAPSTQPESIPQVLKRSFLLYRHVLKRVIVLSFLIAVIAFIPRLLALIIGQDRFADVPQLSPERPWLVLIEFSTLTLFTIMLWRVRCDMYNMQESVKDDLSIALKKLPSIFGAVLVQSGILISLFLMMMGMVYLLHEARMLAGSNHFPLYLIVIPLYLQSFVNTFIFVLLMFYLPLILTENKHIFEALGKSAVLVWGNWWRTLVTQITPWFIYLMTLLFVRNILQLNIHIFFSEVTQLSFASTCIHILIFTLFLPWFATTMLVQLQDLEIRKAR